MTPVALPSSFFVRDTDDRYRATELTAGPWGAGIQHGGPPSALMAGVLARYGADSGAHVVTRITIELLRPIPIDVLAVEVNVRRQGRRVQWIEASLVHDGREVAHATAVRIRRTQQSLPPSRCAPVDVLPGPDASDPFVFPFFPSDIGYHSGVECRVAEGSWGQGPAAMWIRPRVPLVHGQTTTPLQCVLLAADASNGVCPVLDTDHWAFINPDLTVHLNRPPRGTWVGLRARSTADAGGTGLVDAEVHDERGQVGRAALSLVVGPRPR